MNSSLEILNEGSELLKPLMKQNDFKFSVISQGQSSGGNFACGTWLRENRKLEYHYRHSLGLVKYYLGDKSVDHEFFIWAITGKKKAANYPSSSKDNLSGFESLLSDLNMYCSVFLSGADDDLKNLFLESDKLKEYWESSSPFKRLEIK